MKDQPVIHVEVRGGVHTGKTSLLNGMKTILEAVGATVEIDPNSHTAMDGDLTTGKTLSNLKGVKIVLKDYCTNTTPSAERPRRTPGLHA